MSNKLLIEVSNDDQLFVENVCTNAGYTFASFFSHLLSLYKRSLNEPMTSIEEPNLHTEERPTGKIKKQKAKD